VLRASHRQLVLMRPVLVAGAIRMRARADQPCRLQRRAPRGCNRLRQQFEAGSGGESDLVRATDRELVAAAACVGGGGAVARVGHVWMAPARARVTSFDRRGMRFQDRKLQSWPPRSPNSRYLDTPRKYI